ncbi:DUF3817 domain-containing protein [Nocardioides euryhalodurans]|uniref:DUF3817 domain-containing protein n=1 Tax=Nocardioides euryhalodurans TaxID=2518370 RepID=A0A4P7GLG3_9ACTN|nr:DUF3817 domain-containing protein [Nocardioides euryhalodurans]QBR92936.1 DUF3817 domain-containing protein [Nocardioides euryhalodurans]
MTPRLLFRTTAVAEAVTWGLLLTGMFLKYVTGTTELGVRIGGMLHGVVFVAYVLTALAVAVDARWSPGRTLLALVSAVPPFMTIWFERSADRRHELPTTWRLREAPGRTPAERVLAWLVRNPAAGAGVGVVAVATLTGVALLVGPPVG